MYKWDYKYRRSHTSFDMACKTSVSSGCVSSKVNLFVDGFTLHNIKSHATMGVLSCNTIILNLLTTSDYLPWFVVGDNTIHNNEPEWTLSFQEIPLLFLLQSNIGRCLTAVNRQRNARFRLTEWISFRRSIPRRWLSSEARISWQCK